jgi:hypothetical protein
VRAHAGGRAQPEMSARATHDPTQASEDPEHDVRLFRRTLPIHPTAPAIARDAIARFGGVTAPGLQSHAQLLVSELVTHRVRRAPPDTQDVLSLDISLTPSRLRVQVTDNHEQPVLVSPDPGEPTMGWELQLVAELADRWGLRHDASTTLWFELDR